MTWFAILSLVASAGKPEFLIAFAISLTAALAIQSEFWRFLAARRGWGFAIAAMPLHLLYFTYSGLAFGAGLLMHLVGIRPPEAQLRRAPRCLGAPTRGSR